MLIEILAPLAVLVAYAVVGMLWICRQYGKWPWRRPHKRSVIAAGRRQYVQTQRMFAEIEREFGEVDDDWKGLFHEIERRPA